ncbi:MAG: GNAT family N-acetyltransferase [Myxococcota bacterium]
MNAPPGSLPTACDLPSPAPRAQRPTPVDAARPGLRVTTGFANGAQRATVLAWLGAGLRPDEPDCLLREYPLLWQAGSRATPVTVWSGARPLSFCMLWPTRFELASGGLRSGLISLVFTDPDARGRGLARDAIAAAFERAREEGLGVVLLWSDGELSAFYARQGFSRTGSEQLLAIDRAIVSRAITGDPAPDAAPAIDSTAASTSPATPDDWDAIEAMRSRRACGLRFGRAERDALARVPGLEVRVAREAGGVTAFAMQGRGEDFAGVVHEWGGDATGVLRCLEAWLPETRPEHGLLLLAPAARQALTWRLRSAGARVIRHPLAWMRIASTRALAADLEKLAPGLAARATWLDAKADAPPAVVRLRDEIEGGEAELTPPELLDLLFTPACEPAHAAVRARVRAVLPATVLDALPLPFFVWGLESI